MSSPQGLQYWHGNDQPCSELQDLRYPYRNRKSHITLSITTLFLLGVNGREKKNYSIIKSNDDKLLVMKYKPELFKLTGESIKQYKNGFAIASEISDFLYNAATLAFGDFLTYKCGNPNCRAVITHSLRSKRPLVCSECGEEIDWGGNALKKVKICPQCNQHFSLNKNYCPYHVPKVALVEKEFSSR